MNNNTIKNGIGSPRVWLYVESGDLMRDFDEQPISKYLTKFHYEYNEEQDEDCQLVFMFPSLRTFDLPYFNQDVVFLVEWGYVTGGGQLIKSPRRTVAVRDMDISYKTDGIKLTLKCTDIVSYIKGMRTKTIRTYSGGSETAADKFANNSIIGYGMYLNELSKGGITFTQRRFYETLRINTTGELKVQSKKNPLVNDYTNIIVNKDFMIRPRVDDTIVKGNGKSLDWFLKKTLEDSTEEANSPDFGKPPIADSTDNNIEIKYRDFSAPIFKAYTWYGGNGELLDFTINTNTRKNKENRSASTGVDPFTKTVSTNQVDAIDTNLYKKYSKGTLATVFDKLGDRFKDQVMNHGIVNKQPNSQIVISTYKGKEVNINTAYASDKVFNGNTVYDKNTKKSYSTMNVGAIVAKVKDMVGLEGKVQKIRETDLVEHVTYNYSDILNSPDFKSYSSNRLKSLIDNGNVNRSRLSSYTVENIMRKFEGEARMIGDPTLIKGKIYQFNNLRKKDIGKWYATSVKHSITMEEGYICDMKLMRNPQPIGISAKTLSINPKFDRVKKTLNIQVDSENHNTVLFEQEDEDNNNTVNAIDNPESDKVFREESPINGMEERAKVLRAEKDSLDDLDTNDEFTIAVNDVYYENETEDN